MNEMPGKRGSRRIVVVSLAIAGLLGLTTIFTLRALSETEKAANAMQGKPAPDFTLPDQTGKSHALTESKGKWVVLAFYPKDASPGCTIQNHSYTDHKADFAPLNAVVYTISTQDTNSKKAFCEQEKLSNTLLSDVGGNVAKAYRVLLPLGVAQRFTFYISPDGVIAAVDTKVKTATAAPDSIAMLTKLQQVAPLKS